MRRSWRVTAKRSWPTSAVRRSAFSSETWAMPASPMATSDAATTIGTMPSGWNSIGHTAIMPDRG